jgi:hypothetical protein
MRVAESKLATWERKARETTETTGVETGVKRNTKIGTAMTALAAGMRNLRQRVRGIGVAASIACAAAMFALLLSVSAGTAIARVVPEPFTPAVFDHDYPPTARTVQRSGVSLQQATQLATRRFPGRVVRAETIVTGGRQVHVIRILSDDNRVRTVRIDADTGNFI